GEGWKAAMCAASASMTSSFVRPPIAGTTSSTGRTSEMRMAGGGSRRRAGQNTAPGHGCAPRPTAVPCKLQPMHGNVQCVAFRDLPGARRINIVSPMVDYGAFERAIGLNWYNVDPNLQALMDRLLDPADREWAEGHLVRIGALCGGPIAERAETVDKNPPRLERYDRWGKEVYRVIHHPATIAAKRDAWEGGISGPRLRREAERRGPR